MWNKEKTVRKTLKNKEYKLGITISCSRNVRVSIPQEIMVMLANTGLYYLR
jgi:hypothetical protein